MGLPERTGEEAALNRTLGSRRALITKQDKAARQQAVVAQRAAMDFLKTRRTEFCKLLLPVLVMSGKILAFQENMSARLQELLQLSRILLDGKSDPVMHGE